MSVVQYFVLLTIYIQHIVSVKKVTDEGSLLLYYYYYYMNTWLKTKRIIETL